MRQLRGRQSSGAGFICLAILTWLSAIVPAAAQTPAPTANCRDGTTEPIRPGVCKAHGGVKKAEKLTTCADGTRDHFSDHVCAGHGGPKQS
jgi:hypothetical protein